MAHLPLPTIVGWIAPCEKRRFSPLAKPPTGSANGGLVERSIPAGQLDSNKLFKRWTCNLPLVYCIGFDRQDFAFLSFWGLLYSKSWGLTINVTNIPICIDMLRFSMPLCPFLGRTHRAFQDAKEGMAQLKRFIHRSRGTIQSRDLPILWWSSIWEGKLIAE